MNSFAIVESFVRFESVHFYTVKCEDKTLSEAEDFFERMEFETDFSDQLEQLIVWMENIGNDKEGATADLFRHERLCVALPPKGKYLHEKVDLRLYCDRVNDRIVILYNGGIKTAAKAQDCPNVSHHYYNAQSWTRQLNDIGIETEGNEIINLDELIIKF